MPPSRNFPREIAAVNAEITAATIRLYSLLDEWAAQNAHEKLEWLESLKRAEHRAAHAERQADACAKALTTG